MNDFPEDEAIHEQFATRTIRLQVMGDSVIALATTCQSLVTVSVSRRAEIEEHGILVL